MTLTTEPLFWINATVGIFSIVSLIKILLLRRENRLLSEQLTSTTVSLDRVRRERDNIKIQLQREPVFNKKLQEASVTTDLQHSRLSTQTSHSKQAIPEKYSFIASMAEKGMKSEEIAGLLSISSTEAEQLVALAQLARPSSLATEPLSS